LYGSYIKVYYFVYIYNVYMTHIVIVIYCGTFKENMKQWKVTLHRMRTPLRDKHYRYR